MYCSNCGKVLPPDAKFCGNCGTKVNIVIPPPCILPPPPKEQVKMKIDEKVSNATTWIRKQSWGRVGVVLLAAIVAAVVIRFVRGNGITGTWVPVAFPDSSHPQEYITFNKDGTGSEDGYIIEWSEDDDILYVTVFSGSSTRTYEWPYSHNGSALEIDGYGYIRGKD